MRDKILDFVLIDLYYQYIEESEIKQIKNVSFSDEWLFYFSI
jgi:hypothetical protein